ncbi:MAG: TetR/AcrR family transcriptional regulator [Citrobacter freundii]|nr:MAG: TetR/AcrR family transcriptional regulator [Citrobacter freundii]
MAQGQSFVIMARTKDFDEQAVLKKAIQLFSRRGYAATSMQEVVDALGISRSSLYDTFGDKHQLYLQALKAYKQESTRQLAIQMSEAKSMKAAIRDLLEATVKGLLQDRQQKGCLLTNAGVELAAQDKAVRALVCQGEQDMEELLLQALKRGQASGEISSAQSAQSLARFLSNTIKGFQVAVKSNTDPSFFADIIEVSLRALD